jgi:proline dehydrogenase
LAFADRAIVRVLPVVPKGIVRKISDRYIAGTEIADACRVVKELNEQGKMATIDVLGEEISSRREALGIVRAYHDVWA